MVHLILLRENGQYCTVLDPQPLYPGWKLDPQPLYPGWKLQMQDRWKSVWKGLRKQPTSRHAATTGFTRKWSLRNERRNTILKTRHYPDLGSASDWLKQIFNQSDALPRSRWWHVTSMEFLRSFPGETCGGVAFKAFNTCRFDPITLFPLSLVHKLFH